MSEKKREMLFIASLLVLLVLFFSKILFTSKIIRAPDIINEFYWSVKYIKDSGLSEVFDLSKVKADWNLYINSGHTNEGGMSSVHFLVHTNLLFYLLPAPASVAWFIVLHLFFGATGTYLYCRTIGASRPASFIGGLIFALAPENASLINAGHVMKIATISFAPWAFYFFEKGFQTRRLIFFLTTALVLAFQFFNIHWQVAYYTCLAIGMYAVLRLAGILISERKSAAKGEISRVIGLSLVTMLFFLSTVAISLLPLAHWSTETTRGAKSGAGGGKGGISVEEGMLWSMPPEELGTFIIPGIIGLSRQEAGENPTNIRSYYWGRMIMTQTTDYMGLLPWLLLPLPLIFWRDRYTWIAIFAIAGGIVFSMGKYTFAYRFLFDYFPGIDRFRVPKMMMFIPVLGLGVTAARGLDILLDEKVRGSKNFKRYINCILLLPLLLLLLLGIEVVWKSYWVSLFYDMLRQPTRYEYGTYLIEQRWGNLVIETGIAAIAAGLYAASFWAFSKRWLTVRVLPFLLLLLFLIDVGRINAKFMFLVDLPKHVRKDYKTPAMEFLAKESKDYRVLPMNGNPMTYATNEIPVLFTSNPVQQRRWEYFLDSFSPASSMADILNVKYIVYTPEQYDQNKLLLGNKYVPVYKSPDGAEMVVENRNVLPKGWLVPEVFVSRDATQIIGTLQHPGFDPRRVAVVESKPPIPMADPNIPPSGSVGEVVIDKYEAEFISLTAKVPENSLLVLGEKYYDGWKSYVDGKPTDIYRVDFILRGIYLTPGTHKVEFFFDPMPFKLGKYLTLSSFAFFAVMVFREIRQRKALKR